MHPGKIITFEDYPGPSFKRFPLKDSFYWVQDHVLWHRLCHHDHNDRINRKHLPQEQPISEEQPMTGYL